MMRNLSPAFTLAFLACAIASGANLGCCLSLPERRASRVTALLNLFYPDHDNFWLGLIPGISGGAGIFVEWLSAALYFPRIWYYKRCSIFCCCWRKWFYLLWQPWLRPNGESPSSLKRYRSGAGVVADGYALWR
ncbi:DUF2919 domain-containing protein [Klebsiella pneumoniae]|nr:DUF2919 domain-containing protein [Klebsiella pneumoniae]